MQRVKQGFKKYLRYWGEVVKMWWRDNFKNYIGVMGILVTFGFLIAISVGFDAESYALWILGGITVMAIMPLFFWIPYKIYQEGSDLLELKTSQFGNEDGWLHLVCEGISLERVQSRSAEEIAVRFSIDSGLLYNFSPFRMWISPILGGWEPEEAQHEMIDTPNFSRGMRFNRSTLWITVKDGNLLAAIQDSRANHAQGKPNTVSKALKVALQLRDGDKIRVLKTEPHY